MSDGKKPVPGVAIDEALELFLAAACPQGLPEGEERERLLAALREKVAADRPDWAAACPAPESDAEAASEGAPPPGYSQIKAEIAEQAREEAIPSDPEERFFYLRDQEAQAERERRKEEEREEQAREELRQKALARNEGVDKATMERALAIRQVLEERVRQLRLQPSDRPQRPLTPGSPGPLELGRPATGGGHDLELAATSSEDAAGERGIGLDHGPVERTRREEQDREPALDLRDPDRDGLDRDAKIETLRRFHEGRRERLRSREEVLESRRPELRGGRRESLPLEDEGSACSFSSSGLDLEEGLELGSPTRRRRGLSLS